MADENYHQALMRRLSMIQDIGAHQTELDAAQGAGMFNAGQVSANMPPPQQGQGGFAGFLSAISGQESGGNYGAVNKSSGALGKYQIMPANLGGSKSGWDYEALGRDVTPQQFLKSAQLQEAIATYKLRSYYNKWGPAGAAVAWYAGPGAVGGYLKNPGRYNGSQGAYPSIASYVQQILSRMG